MGIPCGENSQVFHRVGFGPVFCCCCRCVVWGALELQAASCSFRAQAANETQRAMVLKAAEPDRAGSLERRV